MTSSSGRKTYFDFIDGLRAVAVIPVVLFHADRTVMPGGFVGVDIFFVISGFLITGLCLKPQFSLKEFWVRRCRRILPAYFATMTVTAVLSLIVLLPHDLIDSGNAMLAGLAFLQNFVFWKDTNYFSPSLETNPFLHTWSLAVEWQFYLVWPIVLMAFAGRGRAIWWITAFVFIVTLAASTVGAIYRPTPTFYLMPFRVWEFLCGGLVAMLIPAANRHGGWLPTLSAAGGLVLIGISLATFDSQTVFPGASALLPCVGTAAILWGGLALPGNRVNRWLSTAPMRIIGQASYSIYLVHWPLIVLTRYVLVEHEPLWVTLALVAASFLLGIASWRFIEMPLRKPGSATWEPWLRLSAASTVVLAASAALILSNAGIPQRFDDDVNRVRLAAEDQGAFRDCLGFDAPRRLGEAKCRLGAPEQPIDVVLWGDSHAAALADGIDAELRRRDLAGVFVGTDSCPPLGGMESGFRAAIVRCKAIQDALPAMLRQSPVDMLVVEASWSQYYARDPIEFTAKVERQFADYRPLADKVLIIGTVPGASRSVPTVLARAMHFGRDVDLQQTAEMMRAVKASNRIVRDAARKNGFAFIDLVDLLCDRECSVTMDGRSLYFDAGHFTGTSSRALMSKTFRPLLPGVSEHKSASTGHMDPATAPL